MQTTFLFLTFGHPGRMSEINEILVARYHQFCTGVGHFRRIFDRAGDIATNQCWCQSDCRFMWYQNIRNTSFSFVTMHASDRQTDGRRDGQTDGQNGDSNTGRSLHAAAR